MRTLAFGTLLALVGVVVGEDKKEAPVAVRELPINKLDERPKGKVTEPTVITSVEELKKAFPSEEIQAAVKKNVDFSKEKALFFGWSGSGRDQLSFKEAKSEKGLEVVFTYMAGLTRDLRGHAKLYVMPKDATFKVVTNR